VSARLLLPVLTAAAAAVAVVETGASAPAPAAASSATVLPWRRVDMHREPAPATSEPVVLLYVAASCPHCEGVATYTDSAAHAQGRRLLVVSADADSTMRRWRARTGVRAPIVFDTARAMKRALGVRFVPLVVAWHANGTSRRATGADRVAVRRALEATR
jgi:hypothetical protein